MNLQEAWRKGREQASGERCLLWAVTGSTLVHLAILWPATVQRQQLLVAQPLVARLSAVVSLGRDAEEDAPPGALANVEPIVPSVSPPASTSLVKPAARRFDAAPTRKLSGDSPRKVADLVPGATDAPSSGTGKANAVGGSALTPDLAAATGEGEAAANDLAAPGIDPEAVTAYRFALMHATDQHYSDYAKERGWSGEVRLRVTMAENGRPREVAMLRSSGHRFLDREAQRLVENAAKRATLPVSLRGREFPIELGVEFGLKD